MRKRVIMPSDMRKRVIMSLILGFKIPSVKDESRIQGIFWKGFNGIRQKFGWLNYTCTSFLHSVVAKVGCLQEIWNKYRHVTNTVLRFNDL